jgi:hypothetical protein
MIKSGYSEDAAAGVLSLISGKNLDSATMG